MKKGELITVKNLVLSDTDFENIQKALTALNWTWISEIDGSESVPSVAELKSKAKEIMNATGSKNVGVYIQATHGCCENAPKHKAYIANAAFVRKNMHLASNALYQRLLCKLAHRSWPSE